jgi:hypothetical protein
VIQPVAGVVQLVESDGKSAGQNTKSNSDTMPTKLISTPLSQAMSLFDTKKIRSTTVQL